MNAKTRLIRTACAVLATVTVAACSSGGTDSSNPADPSSSAPTATESSVAETAATGILVAFKANSAAAKVVEKAGLSEDVLAKLQAEQAAAIANAVSKGGGKIVSSHPRSSGAILVLLDKNLDTAQQTQVLEELAKISDVHYVEIEGSAQIS